MGLITKTWYVPVSSSASYVWEEKLRRTKKSLKKWPKNTLTPTQNKAKALLALEEHQLIIEVASITKEEIEKEISLHHDLQTTYR